MSGKTVMMKAHAEEPVRCGEKRRAGVPPVEATSEGSPRCSNWRYAEAQRVFTSVYYN
ncbi:hypothetical protein ACF3DV_05275 [Chlorogloeopsis fritschii PCC 9212]|uniref:hypothetical protein n=1 Tax=Chlorogloeopsis fritschii TaxID=1124 RepID=UPI0012F6DF0F|nr:hypothetical protein [Chlorogloeopsis fritschii]